MTQIEGGEKAGIGWIGSHSMELVTVRYDEQRNGGSGGGFRAGRIEGDDIVLLRWPSVKELLADDGLDEAAAAMTAR